MLRVVEIFRAIQGEGHYMGAPSLFLRLGRCNLSCSGCDTKFDKWDEMEAEQVAALVRASGMRHLVVTGGEPTLWQFDLIEMLGHLRPESTRLFWEGTLTVETNGAVPMTPRFVEAGEFFSFSPKVGSLGRDEVFKWDVVLQNLHKVCAMESHPHRAQIKYVLDPSEHEDLERIAKFQGEVDSLGLDNFADNDVFFQPYDTGTRVNVIERARPFVVYEYAETLAHLSGVVEKRFDGRFRVLPQLHKILIAGGGLQEEVDSARRRA